MLWFSSYVIVFEFSWKVKEKKIGGITYWLTLVYRPIKQITPLYYSKDDGWELPVAPDCNFHWELCVAVCWRALSPHWTRRAAQFSEFQRRLSFGWWNQGHLHGAFTDNVGSGGAGDNILAEEPLDADHNDIRYTKLRQKQGKCPLNILSTVSTHCLLHNYLLD